MRFEPHWQEYQEYFFIHDTEGYPVRIVDGTHFDGDEMSGRKALNLEFCKHICKILNELDLSYKRELQSYEEANTRLQKEVYELREELYELKQGNPLVGLKKQLRDMQQDLNESLERIESYEANKCEIIFKE